MYILIRTHYVSATNTKPARIVADDGRGHKVTVNYDQGLNGDDNERIAAQKLADKMQWKCVEPIGEYKEDHFFTIMND